MDEITIEPLAVFPDASWNAYVDAHPLGSLFHLSEWGAVYNALPWITPCSLLARRAGAIVGVMPLARVRWGLGAGALVTAPYCVQAGAIADNEAIQRALEQAAVEHGRRLGLKQLEVRQSATPHPDWPRHEGFAGFCKTLAADDETNLKAVPRKQRAMIRKGEGKGLSTTAAVEPAQFYALYAESVRDLGTPVFSQRLFAEITRHFGTRVGLFGVADAHGPVAAVMSFYYKSRVMPYYAGATARARNLQAYDVLYWRLMQDAVARDCTQFDFGRSVIGSGAWSFKKNWGFTPQTLCYQFVALAGGAMQPLDPDSAVNRFARRAWTHLPLTLANRLGPMLSRRLY